MDYIKISILTHSVEKQEMIIARLSEMGFDGFEQLEDSLNAYVPTGSFSSPDLSSVLDACDFTVEIVPEQNWNEQWESNFEPVVIEHICGIRAEFHDPIPNVPHEIIITPKMSFGTGHHATTRLMMVLMSELDFKEKTVFDFGTGTGVLAIFAEKLGAASVKAIDNDEWSVTNTLENLARNQAQKVTIELAEGLQVTEAQYDIVLANINRNILLQYLQQLYNITITEGKVLMSGLLESDKEIITDTAESVGFITRYTIGLNNWIAILLEKPAAPNINEV
ncbi:MAG: 50S ribosomal protein L11 methyltransferase [Chitinophagia bacterium]|nr:50S ribosomal protein L11 methyltransferase [Chitinophagia bacterium]